MSDKTNAELVEEAKSLQEYDVRYDSLAWQAIVLANALAARLAAAEAENAKLRQALAEAADDIAGWGGYASEYFQDKHGLRGCVARYHALAAKGTP